MTLTALLFAEELHVGLTVGAEDLSEQVAIRKVGFKISHRLQTQGEWWGEVSYLGEAEVVVDPLEDLLCCHFYV